MENPNDRIPFFVKKCDTIKTNGFLNDAICLRLFPALLADNAKSWLLNSNANSFTHGMVSSIHFCANTSPLGKLPNFEIASLPSPKWRLSPYMTHGSSLRILNGNVLIMASQLAIGTNIVQRSFTIDENLHRQGHRGSSHGQNDQLS